MSKSQRPEATDYAVGYGRPPRETRFQPGRSGNPTGRPRKRKTVGAVIEEALARRIKVQENGRSRSLSAEEIIVTRLTHNAARGDLRAVKMLYSLRAGYRESPAESIEPSDLQADKDILDAYVKRQNAASEIHRSPEAGDADSDSETSRSLSTGHASDQEGENA